MHPDNYTPPDFISPCEFAVIELERLVEDLTTYRLSAADVQVIQSCIDRLVLLVADCSARRAA